LVSRALDTNVPYLMEGQCCYHTRSNGILDRHVSQSENGPSLLLVLILEAIR